MLRLPHRIQPRPSSTINVIVSDWLWVARERAQGATLVFYPASTAIGAVMLRDAADALETRAREMLAAMRGR